MYISHNVYCQVLQLPLDQMWLVDLYGNIKLTIQFAVEGKTTNVTLKAAESISFATFGGLYPLFSHVNGSRFARREILKTYSK